MNNSNENNLESFDMSLPSIPALIDPLFHFDTNKNIELHSITYEEKAGEKLGHESIKGERSYQQEIKPVHKNEEKRKHGCTCKKTMCLKMYCECFRKGRNCNQSCQCCECYNDGEHEDVVFKAKGQVKNKEYKSSRSGGGCNCKKSSCLKKYCECFNSQSGCGPSCKCVNCKNQDYEASSRAFALKDQ